MTPIWGVEMDPETMQPKTERIELVHGNWSENGYEVCGEDHCDLPLEDDALEAKYRGSCRCKEWIRIICHRRCRAWLSC